MNTDSKEKKVIEAYYERERQKLIDSGRYDPSKAFINGMGMPESSINSANIVKPINQAEALRNQGSYYTRSIF